MDLFVQPSKRYRLFFDLLAHSAHPAYKFEKLGMPQPDDYGTKLANRLGEIASLRSQ